MIKKFFDLILCFDEFTINQNESLYTQEWYSGTTSKDWIPYYKRNPNQARFALRRRGVGYFATNCERIDIEIGDYFKSHKTESSSPDFNRELWPRMTGQIETKEKIQEIKGAFRINSTTKVFDLGTDSKINKLNNLWNKNFQENKDIISQIITKRDQIIYEYSAYFAEQVFEKRFDGIRYKPSTIISNAPLGPCNDSMLVLFEPEQSGRQLFCIHHSS